MAVAVVVVVVVVVNIVVACLHVCANERVIKTRSDQGMMRMMHRRYLARVGSHFFFSKGTNW